MSATEGTVTADKVTDDDILNAKEAGEEITLTGTAKGGDISTDDVVSVVVDGTTYTGKVDSEGNYSIKVPGSKLDADENNTLEISVASSDAAGNTVTSKTTSTYTEDMSATNDVTITDESGDKVINASEVKTSDIEGNVEAGSTINSLTISDGTKTITVPLTDITLNSDGSYSIENVDLSSLKDGELTTSITSTDSAGNEVTSTDTIEKDTKANTGGDGTLKVLANEFIIIDVLENDEVGSIITSVDTLEDNYGVLEIVIVDGKQYIKFTPSDSYDSLEDGALSGVAFNYKTEDLAGNEGQSYVTVNVEGTNKAADAVDDSSIEESLFLGTREEDGTISQWGTSNSDGTLTYTTENGKEITVSATNGTNNVDVGFMDTTFDNQHGIGIGAVGGDDSQLELGETVKINFGGTILAGAEIGIAGLGNHFVNSHEAKAKATWTAYDEDGDIVARGQIQQDDDTTKMTNSFTVDADFSRIEFSVDAEKNSNFTIQYIDANYASADIVTQEDTSLTIQSSDLLANDTDEEGDTFSITSVSKTDDTHGTVELVNGNVVFTPDADYFGDASFTYTITDENGKSDTATVSLTVSPDNDNPIAKIATQSVNEDESITGKMVASDADNDTLTYSIKDGTSTPEGLTFNSDGSYTFDASSYDALDKGANHIIVVPIIVDDSNGGVTETTLSIDISGVNNDLTYVSESAGFKNVVGYYEIDPITNKPIGEVHIVVDNQNGLLGGTHLSDMNPSKKYGFFIIANGADSVDGKDITLGEDTSGKPLILVNGVELSQSGNTNTGYVTNAVYHDNPEFNTDGQDHFTFTSDGNGGTNINIEDLAGLGDADFNDVILNVNFVLNDIKGDTLEVDNDEVTILEDSGSIKIDVLSNDSTQDGNMTITSVDNPVIVNGVTVGSAIIDNNEIVFTPVTNYNGKVSFSYTVEDDNGSSKSATVNVTVTSVNDGPIANDDTVATTLTKTILFSSSFEDVNTGTNNYDFFDTTDGWSTTSEKIEVKHENQLSFNASDGDQYVELNTDDTDTYNDAASIYRMVDTQEGSTYTLNFDYAPRNEISANAASFEVLVNDIVIGSYSEDGTVSGNITWSNGELTFIGDGTPTKIEFKENGENIDYGRGMFLDNISLTQSTLSYEDTSINADSIVYIDVLKNDTDADNDTLNISKVQSPIIINNIEVGTAEVVVINGKDQIKFTPNENLANLNASEVKELTFTYEITDNNGGSDTASVTLSVSGLNDAPTITIGDTTAVEDIAQVIANVSDIDGTIETSSLSATNGAVTIEDNGDITYKPDDNFSGNDSIIINVTDNDGATTSKTFDVSVEAVADGVNISVSITDDILTSPKDTTTINVANEQYKLGGSDNGGSWDWESNSYLKKFINAVEDDDNFSSTGIVKTDIDIIEGQAISDSYLNSIDGFTASWWKDSDANKDDDHDGKSNVQEVADFFNNGGDLLLLQDDSSHDKLGELLGIPTIGKSTNTSSSVDSSELFNGSFSGSNGTGDVRHNGQYGYLSKEAIESHGGKVAAVDGYGRPTMAVWEEGTYIDNNGNLLADSGSMIIVADVDTFTTGYGIANYNSMNNNAELALNTIEKLTENHREEAVFDLNSLFDSIEDKTFTVVNSDGTALDDGITVNLVSGKLTVNITDSDLLNSIQNLKITATEKDGDILSTNLQVETSNNSVDFTEIEKSYEYTLNISISKIDNSETLSVVTISNVPSNAELSSGHKNSNGTWSVEQNELSGLKMTSATVISGNDLETISFSVTSTEENGQNKTSSETADSVISTYKTPIILDLDGDGVETISLENGVQFDIDNDGDIDFTGWAGADDGLLVRDINNDGIINNASELFGESTVKEDGTTASDGYDALRELDSNADGVINADDENFSELSVWKDSNSDGITDEGELLTLEEAGVAEISLGTITSTETSNGNIIGLKSTYTDTDGNEQAAADVWFETAINDLILDADINLTEGSFSKNTTIDMQNGKIDNIDLSEVIMQEEQDYMIFGEDEDKLTLEGDNNTWNKGDDVKIDDEDFTVYEGTSSVNSNIKIFIDTDIDVDF